MTLAGVKLQTLVYVANALTDQLPRADLFFLILLAAIKLQKKTQEIDYIYHKMQS